MPSFITIHDLGVLKVSPILSPRINFLGFVHFDLLSREKMVAILFYYLFKPFPDDCVQTQCWNGIQLCIAIKKMLLRSSLYIRLISSTVSIWRLVKIVVVKIDLTFVCCWIKQTIIISIYVHVSNMMVQFFLKIK